MSEFVEQTKITELEYEPYTFGMNPIALSVIFVFYELFN